MKPVSESARAWAQALANELEGWPGIILKSAFGMTLGYRSGVVFAALPKTRALYVEDAILVKFLSEPPSLARRLAADRHFAAGTMHQQGSGKRKAAGEGRHWRIFVMQDDSDLHPAIEWLAEAYRLAGKKSR